MRARLLSWLALIGAVAAVPPAFAQTPEPIDRPAIGKIREEGLQRSQVMELASWLTDVYGPRLTGSPNLRAASEWVVETLKGWGITDARQEPWEGWAMGQGRGWSNDVTIVRAISPRPFQVYANVAPWTPGTNGTVRGEVILLDTVTSIEGLRSLHGMLRGKFVFTASPMVLPLPFLRNAARYSEDPAAPGELRDPSDYGNPVTGEKTAEVFEDSAAVAFLREEGVLALVSSARGDNGLMFPVTLAGSPVAGGPEIPMVSFAAEHYGRIYRTVRHGLPVVLEMRIDNTFTPPVPPTNIIAELPGTDPKLKGEVVMLGAHLDSWHYGTGATDDGAGAVVMMEAMRILKTIGLPLKRTVRLALWTGEEQGMLGSMAYVAKHFGGLAEDTATTPEHAKLSGYFNLDLGSGAIRGVYLGGNEAVAPIFRAWMEPFKDLDMTLLNSGGPGFTDHISFLAAGLPSFQFIQDPLDYDTRAAHSNMDVYERLQPDDLKRSVAIVAAFVYHAANRAERLPRKS